jgi:putative nucleotidyltransferase with HDIG domain
VGLRVGYGITDDRGRVLVAAGTRMSAGLCQALVRRGYMQIYVLDGIADDVVPDDALRPQTRALALRTVRSCYRDVGQGQPLPLEAISRTVDEVLRDLLASGGAATEFASLQGASEPTYLHSVNVCVYALVIGQAMGVHGEELRALGTGALLHDIGKVLCADVCDKPGPLTAEEWTRVRQHPVDGFEMLRQYRELHLFVAHIAFQHHERMDGSGYPRGLQGDQILLLARIAAVADTYDAIISARPFAKGRPPHEAMEELRSRGGNLFDPEVVRTFVQRMAIYPSATPVLLADGSLAVVVTQTTDPTTPVVRILGRAGQVYSDQEEGPASGDHAIRQVLNRWPRWLEEAFAS